MYCPSIFCFSIICNTIFCDSIFCFSIFYSEPLQPLTSLRRPGLMRLREERERGGGLRSSLCPGGRSSNHVPRSNTNSESRRVRLEACLAAARQRRSPRFPSPDHQTLFLPIQPEHLLLDPESVITGVDLNNRRPKIGSDPKIIGQPRPVDFQTRVEPYW